MVACHVWDTLGAQSAGYTAGLITRPGNAPLPVSSLPQPNLIAPDLPGLADPSGGAHGPNQGRTPESPAALTSTSIRPPRRDVDPGAATGGVVRRIRRQGAATLSCVRDRPQR
jgi:hypothetical protein